MRVGLLSPGWPPEAFQNGIVTYVRWLAPALRDLGVDARILATETQGQSDPRDRVIPVSSGRGGFGVRMRQRVLRMLGTDSAAAGAGRRLARTLRPRVRSAAIELLEMEDSFGWSGEVARAVPVPVVVRLHGPWFLNGPWVDDENSPQFIERVSREGRALRNVAMVTAPSVDVLDRTRRKYGLPLANAVVVPCPMPLSADAECWKSQSCDNEEILFVGRFDAHKGGDLMLDAFAQVRRRRTDARLVMVGPDRGVRAADGRVLRFDEYATERLSSDDRHAIRWLGPTPPDQTAALRRRAAVTVVCSRYETFGYTLAEAMSQGCPVVATRAGALPELVQDRIDGLLAPVEPEGLADTIIQVLLDRALAAALGGRARESCARLLAPAVIAQRTRDIYRSVLEGGRP